MAHSKANMITRTYSGKFGDLCLQRDGVIRSRPNVSKRILSERQTSHLNRFEAAKAYGRQVMADEAKSAFYGQYLKRWKKKKSNIGIYQLAIMDLMHPPSVNRIKLDKQTGIPIRLVVEAFDIFQVAGVSVALCSPSGEILEQVDACQLFPWIGFHYTVHDPSLLRPGVICRVTARDLPGNITEKEFTGFL